VKITSKEIARLAGVSVSTVSLVLNGKPGVGDDTRQQILGILELNGIPLVKKRYMPDGGVFRFCKVVKHGHIINERHNVFISEYTDGIIEEAKLYNYAVEVSTYNNPSIKDLCDSIRASGGLSGCIVLATELSQRDIEGFSGLNIPIVFLDAYYDFVPGDFVTMDNPNMTFAAVNFLKKAGHTKIGMLYADGGSNFKIRYESFQRAISVLNLPLKEEWMIKIGSTHEKSCNDMLKILQKKNRSLPSAFFACNDMVAIGGIRALQKIGYRIPDDISIIGFDDLPVATFVDPPLSSIWVPKHEIGNLSVQMLFNRIANKKYRCQKHLLGGDIINRESVKVLSTSVQGPRSG
jgi:LacI family transcriptional regulator